MQPLNIISACDGIGCAHVTLKRAGIPISKYYSFEIDKYAIAVNQYNHPETIQQGDLNKWRDHIKTMGEPDLIIGSTPCQNLSIAGNRQGLKGDESRLFWEFYRMVDYYPYTPFVFENVASMKKDIRDYISSLLGVEPIMINANLVSAQHRKRLFWTNIQGVEQPEDKAVILQDILEDGIAYNTQSTCVTARYQGFSFEHDFVRHKRTGVAEPVIYQRPRGYNKGKIIVNKSPSITSHSWVENNLLIQKPHNVGHFNKGSQADRVYSVHGKSVCLSANGGGGGAKTGLYKIDLPDGDYIIRKLTPIECERLMTLPDDYTSYGNFNGEVKPISNTQRYKMCGNGIVANVLTGIFEKLKEVNIKCVM